MSRGAHTEQDVSPISLTSQCLERLERLEQLLWRGADRNVTLAIPNAFEGLASARTCHRLPHSALAPHSPHSDNTPPCEGLMLVVLRPPTASSSWSANSSAPHEPATAYLEVLRLWGIRRQGLRFSVAYNTPALGGLA